MTAREISLGNDDYSLELDLTDGVRLAGLRNRRTGRAYLRDSRYARFGNPFTVEVLGANGCYDLLHSAQAFRVEGVREARDSRLRALEIRAACTRAPLAARLRIEAPLEGPASFWQLEIENTGTAPLEGRLIFPRLAGLSVGERPLEDTICLPMQVGGIRRRFAAENPNPLVYPYFYVQGSWTTYAAPLAMPLMDLLSPDE
ncbi:MAG: hypothetical protein QME94_18900, partial [Anaerolineae bacterium]|nr:hypothetical protein [Anaerolineae bacterium]